MGAFNQIRLNGMETEGLFRREGNATRLKMIWVRIGGNNLLQKRNCGISGAVPRSCRNPGGVYNSGHLQHDQALLSRVSEAAVCRFTVAAASIRRQHRPRADSAQVDPPALSRPSQRSFGDSRLPHETAQICKSPILCSHFYAVIRI